MHGIGQSTPKSMLWLDSQMLKIKSRIMQLKLRAIAKTIATSKDNLCRQELIAVQDTCNGKDLLKKFMNICKNLNVNEKSN